MVLNLLMSSGLPFSCSSLSTLLQDADTNVSPEKTEQEKKKTRSRSRSRSRSRKRRSRGHRKSHRHSRHRRSRSRSRRHHDGHGGRRRSRSGSRSRSRRRRRRGRSSSRNRHRRRRSRSRSHSRSRRRHRSRSGSEEKKRSGGGGGGGGGGLVVGFSRRSRSRSRDGPRSNFPRRDNAVRRRSSVSPRNNPPAAALEKKTFKDQMREQFMQAGLALGAASLMSKQGGVEMPDDGGKPVTTSELVSEAAALNLLPNMNEEELYKLASKNPQVARVLLMRSRAEALTGVTVPKYYSLSAVNPLKYAEQMQKRKMLWSRAKDTQQKNEALWTASSAAVAGSGEEASRFRKLMGIKDTKTEELDKSVTQPTVKASTQEAVTVAKKQEELFRNLDKEYEFARVATHSARGVGLGYSNQAFIDPNQFQR